MSAETNRLAYESGLHTARHASTGGHSTVANAVRYWQDHARTLADALGWPVATLQARVLAYHRQRLDAEPSLTTYPELRGYRDRLLAEERGMRDGGLSDEMIALMRSFTFWRDVHLLAETGRGWFMMPQPEKCRILYLADSDQGPIHLKNVDDPLAYWAPKPPIPPGSPWPHSSPLWIDGVGSGLHLDEIPPEIFPVDARGLCRELCRTVDEAREFLLRYNYFWSSANIIVHARDGGPGLAFEKTRCRVAVREGNAAGITFVTGMGALDPQIKAHQTAMRQRYLDQMGLDWTGADGCFWRECDHKWRNMAAHVEALSPRPTFAAAMALMKRRDASGPMCLTGVKCHPDQTLPGCTLMMDAWILDAKRLHRRQWRGETPAYLDTPEIVQFA